MTQLKIIKLNFNAPLHISKGKNEYDSSEQLVRSDTLKSALYVMAKRLGLEAVDSDKGKEFFEAFVVSSAFPYIGEEYFFPKPMVKLPLKRKGWGDEKQAKQEKILKKLEYIGKSVFEKVLKKEEYAFEEREVLANGKLLSNHPQFQGGDSVDSVSFGGNAYRAEQVGRVSIPPLGSTEAPTPFYMERLHFAENAGLYVVVDAEDVFYSETLLPAFRLLAEEGIGTRRYLGNGTFDLEEANMNLALPSVNENTHWLNLGVYCPTRGEWEANREALKGSSFGLLKRGGWLSSPEVETDVSLRKKSLYMFSEGSVFAFEKMEEVNEGCGKMGKVSNIAPEKVGVRHKVWRDGRSVFVPILVDYNVAEVF